MCQDFAKGFVDLCRSGLASKAVAKLRLDHVERGFDVGSFVIALHEAFLIVGIEVEHSFPNRRVVLASRAVRLESDERLRVMVCYYLQIVARQIGFVRAHLGHREVASGCLNQSRELRTIVSIGFRDFDAGNDVGFDSAHQVNLDPVMPIHERLVAVLCFDPLNEAAS